MNTTNSGSSLNDYGYAIYKRDHFTCVYCGYDGRDFDRWMQLSIDHVLPRSCGGTDDDTNRVTACRSCNSITSRMKFQPNTPPRTILQQKRDRVAETRMRFYTNWKETVAPLFLARPLPPLP
jgi:5-methylcytosine-specific restriction endonuclease McrA